MSTISENIRLYRQMRHLTQADLAFELDKSISSIANWERGHKSPDADTFEKLCQILKVTPNQMYGWDDDEALEQYKIQLKKSQEEQQKIKEALDVIGRCIRDLDRAIKEIQ